MNGYVVVALASSLVVPYVAHADVPVLLNQWVVNPSFEVPTTSCCSFPAGWSQGGTATGSDAGNWNPTSDSPSNLTALSGSQVAYINNYSGDTGLYWDLSQTLSIPGGMVAGTTYSLIYGVAVRADAAVPSAFRVQINGDYSPTGCTNCYAITSGSTGSFAPGTWYLETVDYTAQLADQGFQPTIYLVNDGAISGTDPTQVEFDVPVPEPSGVSLLGLQFASVALLSLLRQSVTARR